MSKKLSLQNKIKGYQKAYRKYGEHPKALQWASANSAEIRYRELVKDLDFEGKNILDVGCGFGDIIAHIGKKAKDFRYTGIDIVPEFIKMAKKKFPKHNFIVGDYFGKPLGEKYDIVMTSGTLNTNVEEAMEFRKAAIATMFGNALYAVAFNMAGGHPQPETKSEGRVFYADSSEILEYCLSLTPQVILRQNYHPRDFTVVMFKG